jgi:hypothetical protein
MTVLSLIFLLTVLLATATTTVFCLRAFRVTWKMGYLFLLLLGLLIGISDSIAYVRFKEEKEGAAVFPISKSTSIILEVGGGPPPPAFPLLLLFSVWLLKRDEKQKANQPPQRNAGSRPSSDDSPAPETPSSLGPRG